MSRELQVRKELAAAFRWAARLNFHEAVANHFSMAVSDDGQQFVVNRAGTHFSQVTASGLVLVDTAMKGDPLQHGVDPTAWVLHSYLHRNVPHAKCVLHTHMPYTTALACLKDFEFLMLDQNASAFHGRIAYDDTYTGLASSLEEGERLAALMGDKTVLFLKNHGVVSIGDTVAQAYRRLYKLEKACQTQVLAMSTGKALNILSDEVIQRVQTPSGADRHPRGERERLYFEANMRILDRNNPGYAD